MLIGVILSLGMSVACLLRMYADNLPLIPLADWLIVLNIARHQWDIPVCWLDASYMKVSDSPK
jgi:hypothetical protein